MKRVFALCIVAGFLSACTSTQLLDTATSLISGQIAGASNAGFAPGVTYGNLALGSVNCIGIEVASADTAAIKSIKIAGCALKTYAAAPIGGNQSIIIGINAALDGLLTALNVPIPATANVRAKVFVPANVHVRLKNGSPEMFERHQVLAAAKRALKAQR